jgi:hypothetical protein
MTVGKRCCVADPKEALDVQISRHAFSVATTLRVHGAVPISRYEEHRGAGQMVAIRSSRVPQSRVLFEEALAVRNLKAIWGPRVQAGAL